MFIILISWPITLLCYKNKNTYLSLRIRGLKNRCYPILRPTRYKHKILWESVKPFRRSLTKNTVTRECYTLDMYLNKIYNKWQITGRLQVNRVVYTGMYWIGMSIIRHELSTIRRCTFMHFVLNNVPIWMLGINHDNSFGKRIIICSITNALFLQLRTEIDVQQLWDAPEPYIHNVMHRQTVFFEVCDANV